MPLDDHTYKFNSQKKLNDYISVQLITNTHIPQYDN